MLKKSLLAMAAIGAFAGSAVAADVTLYGLVDYGFNYQHTDGDVPHEDAGDSFTMRSGMNSGSRFGLKGSEDLGNGMKVGFVLENGFNADDGSIDNGGRLFGRESQVYLQGDFGTLSFGRVGQLASANGTYALLGKTSPFSSGWGDSVGQKYVTANGWARFDNTVTYVSPDFAGFKVHAQYSFKNDTSKKGDEGKSNADRYYGLAATYTTDNLYLVGIVDSVNHGKYISYRQTQEYSYDDDQWTFTLGGNYDFQFMKVYAMAQYFKNAAGVGQKWIGNTGFGSDGYTYADTPLAEGADGYGIALGVGVPCLGGTAKAHIGYLDAEASNVWSNTGTDGGLTRWNVAVGYDYNLSKRTSVYTAAAYTKDDLDGYNANSIEPSSVEVMAGLIHKF